MVSLLRLLALSLFSLLLVAAPAAAEEHAHGPVADAEVERLDPIVKMSLSAPRAVARDCTARPLTGRAGVVTRSHTALADGQMTWRLRGRGDWDLAVFDSAGKLASSSAAFGGNEVAQVNLRKGATVLVQACRRGGGSSSARLTSQLARVDWSAVKPVEGSIRLVRVLTSSRKHVDSLERLGFDVTHDVDERGPAVMLYGAADLARLDKLGLEHETLVADMEAADAKERAEQLAWARRVGRSSLPSGRTDYRVLADYQRELKEVAEKHPAIVRPFNLPEKTVQGRDIQALEIAQDVHGGDDGRPVLWLNGIHHAREWPAAESIMEFTHELVNGYGKDPRITKILRDTRIIVQPHTNPDGFVVARETVEDPDPDENHVGIAYSTATGVVIFGGSLSYKRKNCNPLVTDGDAFPCELALGVDNNRNYAHDWGGPGASSNPNDQSYRGPRPFSEPETRAIQQLSSTMNISVNLSMHNVAAKVLRPPGLEEDGFAPDEEGLKALGQKIADATGYKNEYGWQLYDTTGSSKDWEYGALGQYAYTVELGGTGFHGDYKVHVVDQYDGVGKLKGKGLREGFLAAAEWTRDTTQTSRIAGRSLPGRTLRITKSFDSETSEVCPVVDPLFADPVELATSFVADEGTNLFYCAGPKEPAQLVPEQVDMTMTVPASGRFEWFVNPSTRPFVAKAGRRETYTLTCEFRGRVVEQHEIFVARGDVAQVDLPCGGALPADAAPAGGGPSTLPATPAPSTRPGAKPKSSRAGVRVVSARRSGRRARIVVEALGSRLRDVKVALVDSGGRTLGTKRVASIRKRATVVVTARRALRSGTYRVRVSSAGLPTVTRLLKLK